MKRLTIPCALALLTLSVVPSGQSFSLLGQFPAWQTFSYDGFNIGYMLPTDIGGPMVLSEGYRWNVPVLTYAFDESFINYFGSNGITAVEEAVKILNDLPPASLITNDSGSLYISGEPVPTDTRRVNFEAEVLGLLDVKSVALSLLVEEMGLAEPERYAWTLAGRRVLAGPPPLTNWSVIHLNYDPITFQPTAYVNGALYTYRIFEGMVPPVGNLALAVEFPSETLDFYFTSVAGRNLFTGVFGFGAGGGSIGGGGLFFTGLTHDDVGGLRWLYRTNNLATENLLPAVTGGGPVAGSSPWQPYLGSTNFTNVFLTGNFLFSTNVAGSNLVVQGLRPGQNKIRFQRVNYDSLVGQSFTLVTNRYTDTIISNTQPVIQPVQRVIAQPDIVFTAERLGLFFNYFPVLNRRTDTSNWQNNDAINGQDSEIDGGPGVIRPPVVIRFSDQLPFFINTNPSFLGGFDEASAFRSVIWGSFDGTTNAPVIYPAYGSLTLKDLRDYALGRR